LASIHADPAAQVMASLLAMNGRGAASASAPRSSDSACRRLARAWLSLRSPHRRPVMTPRETAVPSRSLFTLPLTLGSRLPPILRASRRGDKVMQNDTPLGTLMHLKELDRQAVPKLRSLGTGTGKASGAAAVGAALIALLRRLHAVGAVWRLVRQA
jgi:hypothetical protein